MFCSFLDITVNPTVNKNTLARLKYCVYFEADISGKHFGLDGCPLRFSYNCSALELQTERSNEMKNKQIFLQFFLDCFQILYLVKQS